MRTVISIVFSTAVVACSSSDGTTSSSSGSTSAGLGACEGWHQTSMCKGNGPDEPQNDKACSTSLVTDSSGYCTCAGGKLPTDCYHAVLTCDDVCAAGVWPSSTSSSSSSSGRTTTTGWADTATCVKGGDNFYECCGLAGGGCTTPAQNAACCENKGCASGKLLACMANHTPSSVDACNAAITACQ